jgi:4-amino-4-deoxy-L-arabinose transferase-like glycosyltransferase
MLSLQSRKRGAINLLVMVVLASLLRIPSLFEPLWNLDEAMYITIGRSLAEGKKLYSDIYDNKPPSLYYLALLANGSFISYRALTFIFGLTSVIIFYFFSQKFFKSPKIKVNSDVHSEKKWLLAVIAFIFFVSTPVFEGNTGNAELFFLLPLLSAIYIYISSPNSLKKLFMSGILMGLGILIKIPVLLDATLISYLLFIGWYQNGNFKKLIQSQLFYSAGISLPILLVGIYLWNLGTLNDFIQANLINNFSYLKEWPVSYLYGFEVLSTRVLLLVIFLISLFPLSKVLDKPTFLILVWFSLGLSGVLLSSRPYTHYFLQIAPTLALAIPMVLVSTPPKKIIPLAILTTFILVFVNFSFLRQKPVEYYLNFLNYIRGNKTYESYISWFGDDTLQNYYLASRLKHFRKLENPENDSIYIYSDNPALYVLTNHTPQVKYFVWFHVDAYSDKTAVSENLERNPPYAIVTIRPLEWFPSLNTLINKKYKLVESVGSTRIYALR